MDVACDHIQEEVLSTQDEPKQETVKEPPGNLNTEFQEAYKTFSASPWGAKLGGFFGNVKKQGEAYYQEAREEVSSAGEDAFKGFTDLGSSLVNRARSMSTNQDDQSAVTPAQSNFEGETTEKDRTESAALRESESLIARFRSEATKRLKDIEKAEDAADEALQKFGSNIRNFLRDAVTIAPPTEMTDKDGKSKVLFESKDQDGKRVIHTTRFDAQLHAIHSSLDSFGKDPQSPEYEKWSQDFDVEKKTNEISTDLETHDELRRAMEALVPEKVEYADFWRRYYFLRMVVESEEKRRREMLKGATLPTDPSEEVDWDSDSDSSPLKNDSSPATPRNARTAKPQSDQVHNPSFNSSNTTIPAPVTSKADTESLKPMESQPRRSQDQNSQPDSDASYDLVSGATSRSPGSPKDEKAKNGGNGKVEDSEEEDWE